MHRPALLLLAPFALAACAGDDTNPAVPDSGVADATVADAATEGGAHPSSEAGVDASTDAGGDAATNGSGDAAPTDASTDAGDSKDGSTSTDADVAGDTGTDASTDDASTEAGADAILSSFVTLGCNRLAKGDWVAATNPSSANVAQLQQDFTDVAAMADKPKQLFFTGDLVLGEVTQLSTLSSELTGWASLYTASPVASSLTLVAVAGNHEILLKQTLSDGGSAEIQNNAPDASADTVWTQWLAASSFDPMAGNGPTAAPPNADQLLDDQSKFSFSFDDGPNHFVVLNTDTWTSADAGTGVAPIGRVPMVWLAGDIQAAQANAVTQNIFLFGHKPIISPIGSTSPDDVIDPVVSGDLVTLMTGSSKVRAYFCAHYHAWDARPLTASTSVYQVIAGNGGSTLETTWNPPVTFFGFTEVRVHASGSVGVVSYQRPVPSPYNATTGVVAATAQPEMMIFTP